MGNGSLTDWIMAEAQFNGDWLFIASYMGIFHVYTAKGNNELKDLDLLVMAWHKKDRLYQNFWNKSEYIAHGLTITSHRILLGAVTYHLL